MTKVFIGASKCKVVFGETLSTAVFAGIPVGSLNTLIMFYKVFLKQLIVV